MKGEGRKEKGKGEREEGKGCIMAVGGMDAPVSQPKRFYTQLYLKLTEVRPIVFVTKNCNQNILVLPLNYL